MNPSERASNRQYHREYLRRNPERQARYRINEAVRRLERAGYVVIPPDQQQGGAAL